MHRTFLAAAFTLIAAACPAATLALPGVPSFDTNLGVLTQAVVTINPLPVTTDPYETNFSQIGSHAHLFTTLPASIPGLASFAFPPTPTSVASSLSFAEHDHTVDLPASTLIFSGGQLNWFLDPANGVTQVTFPAQYTNEVEDHRHLVRIAPTTPQTVFTYTPIPEPAGATLGLLATAAAGVWRRR